MGREEGGSKSWERGVYACWVEVLGVVGRMLDAGCWMSDARALPRPLRPAWSW